MKDNNNIEVDHLNTKKLYSAPQLKEYGKIQELIKGGNNDGPTDGIWGSGSIG